MSDRRAAASEPAGYGSLAPAADLVPDRAPASPATRSAFSSALASPGAELELASERALEPAVSQVAAYPSTAQPARRGGLRGGAADALGGPQDRPARGSLAELRLRLEGLPAGHPSSPYDDTGAFRPPPQQLRQLELPLSDDERDAEPPARASLLAATAGTSGSTFGRLSLDSGPSAGKTGHGTTASAAALGTGSGSGPAPGLTGPGVPDPAGLSRTAAPPGPESSARPDPYRSGTGLDAFRTSWPGTAAGPASSARASSARASSGPASSGPASWGSGGSGPAAASSTDADSTSSTSDSNASADGSGTSADPAGGARDSGLGASRPYASPGLAGRGGSVRDPAASDDARYGAASFGSTGLSSNGLGGNGLGGTGYEAAGHGPRGGTAGYDDALPGRAGSTARGDSGRHGSARHGSARHDSDQHDSDQDDSTRHDRNRLGSARSDSAGYASPRYGSASYDGAGYNGASHDIASHDGASHDGAGRDIAGHDDAGHNSGGYDGAGNNSGGYDTAGRDRPGRDGTGRDGTGRDGTRRDGTRRDGTGHGSGRPGSAGPDLTSRDSAGYRNTGRDSRDYLSASPGAAYASDGRGAGAAGHSATVRPGSSRGKRAADRDGGHDTASYRVIRRDPGGRGTVLQGTVLHESDEPAPAVRADSGYLPAVRAGAAEPGRATPDRSSPADQGRRAAPGADEAGPPSGAPAGGAVATLTAEQDRIADAELERYRSANGRNVFGGYGENGLTPAMRRVEAQLPHGQLAPDSEELSLKPPGRYKAKLAAMIARHPGIPPGDLAAGIYDAARYTFVFEPEHYTDGTWMVHRRLKDQGFDLEARRNRWESPEAKGIRTRWRDSARDLVFEVQFHTPASWDVLQRTHDSYLRITDPATPAGERAQLRAQQVAAAAATRPPARSSEIGDFRADAR